ncbi:hypothetical protein HW532_04590 [Kaustia mangrovi]|uniref:Uncharacterized protein n=1 Tax=Kaustia mangrovi TaxID=2593653 RepID=A0A7S8C285_9HYPH|nr:hypothetical protein [Kaustia mangrovi]QPC42049.1 hypothetical protein HW532_04590 [Kaustia mangrovi]
MVVVSVGPRPVGSRRPANDPFGGQAMRLLFAPIAPVIALFIAMLAAPAVAEPVDMDLDMRHGNGTHVFLRSLDWSDTELRIGIRVINSNEKDVMLNYVDSTYVLTADGDPLVLVPPESDESLSVAGRSTVEGNLVFMGKVPTSGEMSLILNDKGDGGDNEVTNRPRFEFVLPSDAIEDAASKKN